MKLAEHDNAYISPPICTNRLIFGRQTFFNLLDIQPIPYLNKFSFGDVITCLLCKAIQLGYDKYYNDNSHNQETMPCLSGPRTGK